MGLFSFLTADKHESIKIGGGKTVYLLIPQDFKELYKCDRIADGYYDGYGNVGGIDVYDFLSDMIIRAKTDPEQAFRRPHKRTGGSSASYYRDMASYYRNMAILARAEEDQEDAYPHILYGEDWKRELGIALFFNGSRKLPYGLKFTFNPELKYEDIKGFSRDDPSQGCY